jgi:Flp pilus assembly pilin Flp
MHKLQLSKKLRLSLSTGATMVEYALLVMLIAMIAVVAVRGLGHQLSTRYSNTAEAIKP